MNDITKKAFFNGFLLLLGSFFIFFAFYHFVLADTLSERLKGRILLQVQDKGQVWYVDPVTVQRAYLAGPADALRIMKELGLGISKKDFKKFAGKAPANLAGRILIRVEAAGRAYYVYPVDLKMYYLGKPVEAFNLIKKLGLGITNKDLALIPVYPKYAEPVINNQTAYPLHENITATVFWVGEPVGNGSSEDNALSCWDDAWQAHFGGFDDPFCREGYYPCGFVPKENPFYVTVPFNDFNDSGKRKSIAATVVPWANEKTWGPAESMMKNRWVKITHSSKTCYGQVEDTGPYEYNDYNYVFNNAKPVNKLANAAGMDVSPALRDCLGFAGLNNADNKINWQFVNFKDVPAGPWTKTITTSQIYWP